MLSNFIIISENNKRKAEDRSNEECFSPSNIFKKFDISNQKSHDCDKNKEGPNINLKCFKKTYDTVEEKSYITQKIRTKKRQSYARIGQFIMIVISKTNVLLLMVWMN